MSFVNPSNDEPDSACVALQREVQRKLGRVLLRIQQYERLFRALILDSEASGTLATAQKNLSKRKKRFKTMTLGNMVAEAARTFVHTAMPDGERPSEPPEDADEPSFHVRIRIEFSPEKSALIRTELKQLVKLRNALVHHFIEQFDVFSIEGCMAAKIHLDDSYSTVDAACARLTQWATSLVAGQEALALVMASPEFQENGLQDPPPVTGAHDATT